SDRHVPLAALGAPVWRVVLRRRRQGGRRFRLPRMVACAPSRWQCRGRHRRARSTHPRRALPRVTHSPAALLIPELRWDRDFGFSHLQAAIEDALELGVGGFVIVNGPTRAVAELSASLRHASRHPLLIAAPAERG